MRTLLCVLLAVAWPAAGPAKAATDARPVIRLMVDLTDAPRQIFHAQESFAVKPGPLTLFYPKWIPGEHSPSGPLEHLAGLRFTAGGKALPWRRDLENMFALHLDIPAGADTIEASFDFLSPTGGGKFGQSASATPDLVALEWNQVVLYPAGSAAREIVCEPQVKLPAGWSAATALTEAAGGGSDAERHFKPVSLEELVDSPLIAGRYFREVELAPGQKVPVYLDLVADSAAELAINAAQTDALRNLVKQAYALFGAHHYKHYRFLFTLSDNTGHFGLEHHQSSDDRTWGDYFIEPTSNLAGAHLLPHEYVHSWNGKYRRPAGLATPDYQAPMKGELLWVYEGLTEYLGDVLTARSGLWTPDDYRENLAEVAATLDTAPGRTWRPLIDTTVAAQLLYNARSDWAAWRRGTDFYPEGELIWLDADTLIREQSRGARSLDDFCRLFHGGASGPPKVVPYTFDDLVAALNQIAPYDWRQFFHARLDLVSQHAPMGGIERGGWKVVYSDVEPEHIRAREDVQDTVELYFSLGMVIEKATGSIRDVVPGLPAARAGIGPGMLLVAVNGRRWSKDVLHDAVKASRQQPIELLVENAEYFKTYALDYSGGERYPHLERVSARADLLGNIVKPLGPAAPAAAPPAR
jgi:predicted metalloprotease with PDZ domain